jgi:hypothetical protein
LPRGEILGKDEKIIGQFENLKMWQFENDLFVPGAWRAGWTFKTERGAEGASFIDMNFD